MNHLRILLSYRFCGSGGGWVQRWGEEEGSPAFLTRSQVMLTLLIYTLSSKALGPEYVSPKDTWTC